MTWTRPGSTPASATRRSRPWAEWTTTASKRRSSRALGAGLAGARLARQDVVRGQDERPAARQQRAVDLRQRQPLDVDDVGVPGARR